MCIQKSINTAYDIPDKLAGWILRVSSFVVLQRAQSEKPLITQLHYCTEIHVRDCMHVDTSSVIDGVCEYHRSNTSQNKVLDLW